MDKLKDKEVPVGALTKWMKNVDGRKTFKIKVNGQMYDSLRVLHWLGGVTIAKNLRHSERHMREIQKLLVLGLIEQVPKDCEICSGRDHGGRVSCLGNPRKCAARHLYSITMCGLKALRILDGLSEEDYFSYEIDVEIAPAWFKYFQTTVW